MALTNAEKQKRLRDKRDAFSRQASKLRNAPIEALIRDHIKRGQVLPRNRMAAVQLLLKRIDSEEDAELLAWLRKWIGRP